MYDTFQKANNKGADQTANGKNSATDCINLDLRWLPQKLALGWAVTKPGINLDLTCQHINSE